MSADSRVDSAAQRGNLSAWAVRHPTLVLFLALAIAIGGVLSFLRLGQAEDPDFTIKVVVVTAAWPGASAAEMQAQVADPLEKRMQELPYFSRVVTYAMPGFAALQVEFRDDTPPRTIPQLYYQLRKKLHDARVELPAGVLGPQVDDEFSDVDSILFALTAEGADYAQLKHVADSVRQQLLRVPNVIKVRTYGTQEERIFVEFSHGKLATLGVPLRAVTDSLARQNAVAPAGAVETSAQRVPLRVTGALDDVQAVAETPVEAGGRTFRVGDIATVARGFEDPPRYLIRQRGEPALLLGVVMARGANVLTLGRDVDRAMAALHDRVPIGVTITKIADQPRVVDGAVKEFLKSFAEALVIVLTVGFLSLGVRTGVVVALSVPVVLAATFMMMSILGIDLHRITLGALIIALGLLVDDAIISAEMMVVKLEQGFDRLSAASFAWTSTAFPMLTGTLVTAIGFLPIGFANSATGEYAGGIFWVVGIALMTSWIVAVVFTPYFGSKLLRPPPAGRDHAAIDHHAVYDRPVHHLLRRVVRWCVRRRTTVVLVTVGLFAASVVGFGAVAQQFFPLSERPELFFELRMPDGTAIGVTSQVAREAEHLLGDDPDIATATTYVGAGAPRFWLGLNPVLPNEAFAQIVIVAKDLAARERIKARLERAVADGALARARVRVDRFNYGPPVGFPVQFRIIGPDPLEARRLAVAVREIMRAEPRLRDPHLDWNERQPSIQLVVDQERARALGLDVASVSQMLQTLVSGTPVTTVRDGIEKIRVVARAVPAERLDLARLGDLTIPARGGAVPLTQIAHIRHGAEDAILWRRNRDTTVTVRADVIDGVQPPDVTMALWPKLQAVRDAMPAAFRMEIGGAIEESDKGNASLAALFPIMLVAMATVLMVQLQSFSRLALVFATAPLGLIGAVAALLVSGRPFGFVALLGLIALAGMIMRNTVILVDQIESDVAKGDRLEVAIVEATVRRARPVVLTALAAILAMIPLSGSAFWGPMATTIMGGLLVATVLTLVVLPALYALVFARRLRHEREALRGAGAAPEPSLPDPVSDRSRLAAE